MTAPQARTLAVMSGGRTVPQRFPSKAQKGVKRYGFNFIPLLGTSTQIQSAEWRAAEGDLVFTDPQFAAQQASVSISQGNQDQMYSVICQVTTDQNETIEVSAPLMVRRERL